MKAIGKILFYLFILVILNTSCVIVRNDTRKDNGKHKGWYKNTNNPHHPRTTNPGHTKKVAPGQQKGGPVKGGPPAKGGPTKGPAKGSPGKDKGKK